MKLFGSGCCPSAACIDLAPHRDPSPDRHGEALTRASFSTSWQATSGPPPASRAGAGALAVRTGRVSDDLGKHCRSGQKVVAEGRFELPTKGL